MKPTFYFFMMCGAMLTGSVSLVFPNSFNSLPGSVQAYWLNRLAVGLHWPGVSSSQLLWSASPSRAPWLCDWTHFVILHDVYLLGSMAVTFALLLALGFVLDVLEVLHRYAFLFACRRFPAVRRFYNPLEGIPDLVETALSSGFTPADIQAHLAQALHRETPEYKAAWKSSFIPTGFWSHDGANVRRELQKQLDPWPVTVPKGS